MESLRIVLCTFPNPERARQIGTLLVEKQLAACITLIPCAESIYRWQDKVESQTETLAILKTTATAWPAFEKELASLHPYEVPEIIALNPDAVSASYLAWAISETQTLGN